MKIKGEKQGKALQIKILTLGESRVGKACLVERCINDSFNNIYIKSVINIRIKRLEINKCDIDVTIIDTTGQERFSSLAKMY